mmetsp:Transcript_53682/g.68938  ORF Transcript_53682/g.68938 Transcript_53682/m.68938 type:complete len:291 (-) Transcript_53682:797-1669(-)
MTETTTPRGGFLQRMSEERVEASWKQLLKNVRQMSGNPKNDCLAVISAVRVAWQKDSQFDPDKLLHETRLLPPLASDATKDECIFWLKEFNTTGSQISIVCKMRLLKIASKFPDILSFKTTQQNSNTRLHTAVSRFPKMSFLTLASGVNIGCCAVVKHLTFFNLMMLKIRRFQIENDNENFQKFVRIIQFWDNTIQLETEDDFNRCAEETERLTLELAEICEEVIEESGRIPNKENPDPKGSTKSNKETSSQIVSWQFILSDFPKATSEGFTKNTTNTTKLWCVVSEKNI